MLEEDSIAIPRTVVPGLNYGVSPDVSSAMAHSDHHILVSFHHHCFEGTETAKDLSISHRMANTAMSARCGIECHRSEAERGCSMPHLMCSMAIVQRRGRRIAREYMRSSRHSAASAPLNDQPERPKIALQTSTKAT
jgi:hypothetical protein